MYSGDIEPEVIVDILNHLFGTRLSNRNRSSIKSIISKDLIINFPLLPQLSSDLQERYIDETHHHNTTRQALTVFKFPSVAINSFRNNGWTLEVNSVSRLTDHKFIESLKNRASVDGQNEFAWNAVCRWRFQIGTMIDYVSTPRIVVLTFQAERGPSVFRDDQGDRVVKLVKVDYDLPILKSAIERIPFGSTLSSTMTLCFAFLLPIVYGLLLLFGQSAPSIASSGTNPSPSPRKHRHHHTTRRTDPIASSSTSTLHPIAASDTSASEVSLFTSEFHYGETVFQSTMINLHHLARLATTLVAILFQFVESIYDEIRGIFQALRRMVVVGIETVLSVVGVGVEVVEEGMDDIRRDRERRGSLSPPHPRTSGSSGSMLKSAQSVKKSPALRKRVSFDVPFEGMAPVVPSSSSSTPDSDVPPSPEPPTVTEASTKTLDADRAESDYRRREEKGIAMIEEYLAKEEAKEAKIREGDIGEFHLVDDSEYIPLETAPPEIVHSVEDTMLDNTTLEEMSDPFTDEASILIDDATGDDSTVRGDDDDENDQDIGFDPQLFSRSRGRSGSTISMTTAPDDDRTSPSFSPISTSPANNSPFPPPSTPADPATSPAKAFQRDLPVVAATSPRAASATGVSPIPITSSHVVAPPEDANISEEAAGQGEDRGAGAGVTGARLDDVSEFDPLRSTDVASSQSASLVGGTEEAEEHGHRDRYGIDETVNSEWMLRGASSQSQSSAGTELLLTPKDRSPIMIHSALMKAGGVGGGGAAAAEGKGVDIGARQEGGEVAVAVVGGGESPAKKKKKKGKKNK